MDPESAAVLGCTVPIGKVGSSLAIAGHYGDP